MHQRPLQASLRKRIRQLQALQGGISSPISRCLAVSQRLRSTSARDDEPIAPGFIFDIDGVLKIGEKVLPQGQEVRVLFYLHKTKSDTSY